MASSKADAYPSRDPFNADDNNKKKEVGNRRALQEIGNFVKLTSNNPLEGKPITNITKSFASLSIAEVDKKEAENKEEAAPTAGAKVGLTLQGDKRQPRPGKKVTYKEEPETLIIISSDEEEEDKDKLKENKLREVGGNKHSGNNNERSLRKNKRHSLTSVLSARSKAACGVTTKPIEQIVNIDAEDANNELAVVEYIEEIYNFYKTAEIENPLSDYMPLQPSINQKMRMILVDWLVEVHNKFQLLPETLYLAVDIVDRYLSRKVILRRELQLLGISSMLLACKYEEIWAPEVDDFVCISDQAYSREQILVMEKAILQKLEWNLTVPTPYVFLVRFLKAIVQPNQEIEQMAYFIAEIGLMHYDLVVSFQPSLIAASAVYAALQTLRRSPPWDETLKHYTGYADHQLKRCAEKLVSFHWATKKSSLKAVFKKYSYPNRGAVALLPPAKLRNSYQAEE